MDGALVSLSAREPRFLALVLILIVAEFVWHRIHRTGGYDLRETTTSLAIAVGQVALRGASATVVIAPVFTLVHAHRLFDIPMSSVAAWAALFFLFEASYYVFHRASHDVRWLWATHSVHHSSTRLNLIAAYRLGWTGTLSGGWLFYLPLLWLGFPPLAVVTMLASSLTYQLFLHTEIIGRLGPLEWAFNTPSHHRVHHAINDDCIDKNFGGVLIIFDRMFGTFHVEPRCIALAYGLSGVRVSHNPVTVAFREWGAMAADIMRARSLKAAWRAAFRMP